jgi:hypothetical protein
MNRRTFVKTGAWLAVAGGLPPQAVAAPGRVRTMVLVDPALPASRALADVVARRAAAARLEIGDDVGTLWYAKLAPWLVKAPTQAWVIGALRASDGFVLRRLAASAGCRVSETAMPRAAERAVAACRATPSANARLAVSTWLGPVICLGVSRP